MMAASAAVPGSGGVTMLLKKKGSEAVRLSAGEADRTTSSAETACSVPLDTTSIGGNAALGANGGSAAGNSGRSSPREGNTAMSGGAKIGGEQAKIPLTHVEDSTNSTEKGIPPDDIVDSALLSALSDPRERFGLLRLEQTLCDFMKDTSQTYMEVGGPCNSVVIYPQHPQQAMEAAPNTLGTMTPPRLLQQQQQQPTGKQSRFQRLCLHRLADRFNILRETGSELEYGGGPGLIRLVKVQDSRTPKKLLIDLSETEYGGGDEGDTEGLTRSLSGLGLEGKASANRTPSRKMKIMKRSSSSFGSTGSLKDKSSSGSRGRGGKGVKGVKGRNLSDKEKAYAEARARIFNDEAAAAKSEARAGVSSNPYNSAVSSAFSSTVTSPSTTPPPPSSSQKSWSPPLSEGAPDMQQMDGTGEAQLQQQPQERKNNSSNRPKAVAGGGVSKVTWRNRRQEESDPDFQTRHLLPQQPTAPTATAAAAASGWNSGAGATGMHDYGSGFHAAMSPGYHMSQNYYVGAGPQAPPAAFYPQHSGPPPYYHASMQQQQQQQQQQPPVVMISGAGTPSRSGGRGRGGYGGPQPQRHYTENMERGQGAMGGSRRPANINSQEEFPALG